MYSWLIQRRGNTSIATTRATNAAAMAVEAVRALDDIAAISCPEVADATEVLPVAELGRRVCNHLARHRATERIAPGITIDRVGTRRRRRL